MKDWKLLTLSALTPRQRAKYTGWMRKQAASRRDPVAVLYERYKNLPKDVAAGLLWRDMQRPGWDNPPQLLVDQVCAELANVRMLLTGCAQQDIDAGEYVSEENRAEVYDHLLALHRKADAERLAKAAEMFCRETQGGIPCQDRPS